MKAELRVGGVPEHLNTPWHMAHERALALPDGQTWSWTDCPGGTGAMRAMLDQGALDVAVLLTEGAVDYIARGAAARIVGTWMASPLTWGVHVRADSPFAGADDLRGRRYGFSRPGSGSHLMALVDAEQRGWPDADNPVLVQVNDLAGAQAAFEAELIDAFLWEQFMTRPLVRAGRWRCVDTCRAPWPAFVVVARQEVLQAQGEAVAALLRGVGEVCGALMGDPEGTIAQVAARFHLQPEDARQWWAQMRWACSPAVDPGALRAAARMLVKVEALDKAPLPADLIAALPF